jgi:hypothetical protein
LGHHPLALGRCGVVCSVAGISDSVAVCIGLERVGCVLAVIGAIRLTVSVGIGAIGGGVAGISLPIAVCVFLIRVGYRRAVVGAIRLTVAIGIGVLTVWSKTETLFEVWFGVARSGLPSPLKSALVM